MAELSSTLTIEEKTSVKNLAEKFLNYHYYFSTVYPYLPVNKKNKVLEIIAEGRGVIPYEIIVDMESFFIKPDKEFWEKSKFFSELKISAIDDKVKKRVITKILKLDENNQYGNAMNKPLPTGCIKDNKDISWETFNFFTRFS